MSSIESCKVKAGAPLPSIGSPSIMVNTEHRLTAFVSASNWNMSLTGLDNPSTRIHMLFLSSVQNINSQPAESPDMCRVMFSSIVPITVKQSSTCAVVFCSRSAIMELSGTNNRSHSFGAGSYKKL